MGLCVGGGGCLDGATLYKPRGATASKEETVQENQDGLCRRSHVGWMEATLLWFACRAVVS